MRPSERYLARAELRQLEVSLYEAVDEMETSGVIAPEQAETIRELLEAVDQYSDDEFESAVRKVLA